MGLEGVRHLVAQMKTTPDPRRSELAREELQSAAFMLDKRGALRCFASKLAPTVKRVAALLGRAVWRCTFSVMGQAVHVSR